MAAVEVEVAAGLQLVKPPSSSLAASHRLHRPTSPQTNSHSLGEILTLVVRTKMKWELNSVFQKHVGLKVHDLENRPLLKIWLSGVIWRAEGSCCSVQICSRVDVTWLCIFRGTTGCNFVNDPEHGDSPESVRTVQQSKLGQHCNTDDPRQNKSRMDKE